VHGVHGVWRSLSIYSILQIVQCIVNYSAGVAWCKELEGLVVRWNWNGRPGPPLDLVAIFLAILLLLLPLALCCVLRVACCVCCLPMIYDVDSVVQVCISIVTRFLSVRVWQYQITGVVCDKAKPKK
jgi:hypothetical protein